MKGSPIAYLLNEARSINFLGMILQAIRCLILILLLCIAGCDSGPESALDEQKDANFLSGRNRVSTQDYKGAVEEFSKALRTNPNSASAHFELGLLNETQLTNYAAAIYHYEEHLRLRPASGYAEQAKGRIRACKTDLVKNEFLAPVNQGMQRDLERLTAENLLLKRQIEALQLQLSARVTVPAGNSPSTQYAAPGPDSSAPTASNNAARSINTETRTTRTVSTQPKTHVVKTGDTVTSVAAKYDIKLNVFLAANPKVDPRRLKVGQTLNIPSTTQ